MSSTPSKDDVFELTTVASNIAAQLSVSAHQVVRAIELLADGNTIPFIARYRKEATRGLDEVALRVIDDAVTKARELADRKATVLRSIDEQGQLTDSLMRQILDCDQRQRLEDLYLPYKPKRRTRASIARERGLQPLADVLLRQQRLQQPADSFLQRFVDPSRDVPDTAAALAGACDIVAETWSEDADLRAWMLQRAERGEIVSRAKRGKRSASTGAGTSSLEAGEQRSAAVGKFDVYFNHTERIDRIPSHRFLAMKRGEAEGVLRTSLAIDDDFVLDKLRQRLIRNLNFEFVRALVDTVEDCYRRLLLPAAESAVMQNLKEKSDDDAIRVFARNIRELLLAAPAGPRVTMGLDPGFRTGCKVAVVDDTGKYLTGTTVYPTPPRNDVAGAGQTLLDLITQHNIKLIAIGNGTASRETDAFVTALIRQHDLQVTKVVVSEAGASVYSASELAVAEYPDLDVTVRGAISIAHRLQDPLAELVKIDPKAIGVGQYQHDVNQTQLQKALNREVESCVNAVGVDVNTASPSLLSFVAGIGPALAKRIVEYRDSCGRFDSREDLLNVPKLGAKSFLQCAGFLRIRDGRQPLDNSAVHPESYPAVDRIAAALQMSTRDLVGNAAVVSKLRPEDFVDSSAGDFTIRDILAELAKPGRDPRAEFRAAQFAEGIHEISDLSEGMKLEGVVTNVTHFGAFVDIGVHQDGLVHISQLANHFISDPAKVVSVGDIVTVTVLEVDAARKRIRLSRRA
ncbi:MAG: Tex family protein [Planctomycetaceae bacterium]